MVCRENHSQKTGSQTLTKNTRRVGNIEENGTDDTATVQKLLVRAEKAFPPGNIFAAYEFIATQITQKCQ